MKLELDRISKQYEKAVLNDISIELEGYNALAIIGKSGCGKSTLLRLMTGIESPDRGRIVVNEKEVGKDNLRAYQDQIAIVFQQHNLFPHLTLSENISLILEKTRHVEKTVAKEQAEKLLSQLHLQDEINKRPRFVSGGQAQRASIARALSTSPELVFMDEPTAALDPILTKEVLDAVVELKNKGTEFIFVTHEISFVRDFADYVIFMDQGVIEEEGPVAILDNPKSMKLKEFLENERG